MSVALAACVVLVSLSAGLLAVAAWLWATRRRTSIPGPPTLPLLGNALIFYKLPVLWDRLAELHSRYGDIFRFYVGPKLVIVLTQPEDVKCVLLGSKPRQREPYVADVLRTFMGDGLLSINGGTWKRHRKNLEPAFHIEELEKFMDKFNDAGRFLCELLAEKKGTEVELYHPLMHTALRSVVATIVGVDLEWILPGRFRQAEVVDLVTDFGKTLSVVTLAVSGVETTSCAMGYVLCALGLYPEWQDLAQSELDDYFGTGGDYLRSVTPADVANLKAIDAIMKETGRLFTTVPCMPYLVTEDTPLSGGRHVAPQRSTVLIAYYLMHRHPELFPEPDKFDPGRFLEGGSAKSRKAYSYSPFGIGARKCIGNRYAVLQMKVVLATILRRYRILPGTSRGQLEESVISISSHPITGFRVTCVPREKVPSNSV
ncbi:cytochrome P450 4C1-like [Schistocerca nitens]|uniref:cytochrome P450 4C1-like n=1 Tax=Schistocerca nitens TaxID=7011 RepID=UPI0021173C71|nr:cytochrome P450 4C1-like [Schistocerca nitens]